jgi:hypothetical protein
LSRCARRLWWMNPGVRVQGRHLGLGGLEPLSPGACPPDCARAPSVSAIRGRPSATAAIVAIGRGLQRRAEKSGRRSATVRRSRRHASARPTRPLSVPPSRPRRRRTAPAGRALLWAGRGTAFRRARARACERCAGSRDDGPPSASRSRPGRGPKSCVRPQGRVVRAAGAARGHQGLELRSRQGPGEQPALHAIAAQPPELLDLLGPLDALAITLSPAYGHRDHRGHDRRVLLVVPQPRDERPVDLHDVQGNRFR